MCCHLRALISFNNSVSFLNYQVLKKLLANVIHLKLRSVSLLPFYQEHSSVAGGHGQVGIKTVIRESYGPNNVKTITTEKVDMKTGQVISSATTQGHYDVLPKFEESSSSTTSRTSFDFARSALTSERSVGPGLTFA